MVYNISKVKPFKINLYDDSKRTKFFEAVFKNSFKNMDILFLILTGLIVLIVLRLSLFVFLWNDLLIEIFDVIGFLIVPYSIFYIFKIIKVPIISSQFIGYIKNEIQSLKMNPQRGFKTGIYYVISSAVPITFYFFSITKIIQITSEVFLIILIFSITIPIFLGIFLDNTIIKLYKYHIRIKFHYIKKEKIYGVYFISSRLSLRLDKLGSEIYEVISRQYWFPRRGGLFLHFYEYANIFNFREELLNFGKALRDWDITYNFLKLVKKKKIPQTLKFIDKNINLTPTDSILYYYKCMVLTDLIQDGVNIEENIKFFSQTIKKAFHELPNKQLFDSKIIALIQNKKPVLLEIYNQIKLSINENKYQ